MSKTVRQREIHAALFDLIAMLNRPRPDEAMLAAAGVNLDRALFPLLVRIGRAAPIGVVELAEISDRDHSTVSRQVAKLEALGLIERRPSALDRRVREAIPSAAGRAMLDRIDTARDAAMDRGFASWSEEDVATLSRLLRRMADASLAWGAEG